MLQSFLRTDSEDISIGQSFTIPEVQMPTDESRIEVATVPEVCLE
jgi:hypothetical protein